jgi:hypothetical protein
MATKAKVAGAKATKAKSTKAKSTKAKTTVAKAVAAKATTAKATTAKTTTAKTATAKAPGAKAAKPRGASAFVTPKYHEFTIRNNSGVVGHVRLKPNAIAWKPKGDKAGFRQISLEQLATFANEHGKQVQN